MRPIAMLALFLLVAGCAAPESGVGEPAPKPRASPHLGTGFSIPHVDVQEVAEAPELEPIVDPEAPQVFLNGTPSYATALLVREFWGEDGLGTAQVRTIYRYPCGGAVLAHLPGAYADPRRDLHSGATVVSYHSSIELRDATNRSWITDRYVDAADPENATRMLFVQNAGGVPLFKVDDGRAACKPFGENETAYNILLHATGGTHVEVRFEASARPPVPAERRFE